MEEKKSTSEKDTQQIGIEIGQKLQGGELIVLEGDLGAGKTTFVRGLVEGAGSKVAVSSPSFVIKNEYKTDKLIINHFDFYRLTDPGILAETLTETMSDKKSVSVIEWSDIVKSLLNKDKLIIRFKVLSNNERLLEFEYDENLKYLV